MHACLKCRAWRRGVSEILTFIDTPAGLGDFKGPLSPKQTLACWAALVNWHPCLGLELSPLYSSPLLLWCQEIHTHTQTLYSHTQIHIVIHTDLEWVGGRKLFLLLLFLRFGLFSFTLLCLFLFHCSKAIWLKPATPVRHQLCCTSR